MAAKFHMRTPDCFFCHKPGWLDVPLEAYYEFRGGQPVQVAFSNMSTDEREQILSGTHVGECSKKWDELFLDMTEYWEDDEYEETDGSI